MAMLSDQRRQQVAPPNKGTLKVDGFRKEEDEKENNRKVYGGPPEWKVSGETKYTVYCCKVTLDSHNNWESNYCKCCCTVLHIMLFLIDFFFF